LVSLSNVDLEGDASGFDFSAVSASVSSPAPTSSFVVAVISSTIGADGNVTGSSGNVASVSGPAILTSTIWGNSLSGIQDTVSMRIVGSPAVSVFLAGGLDAIDSSESVRADTSVVDSVSIGPLDTDVISSAIQGILLAGISWLYRDTSN
jgi:hypothetical protein